MTRDWARWHEVYYDADGSSGRQRLRTVQLHIQAFLDAQPAGEIRIIDACAGQGRDLLPVLADSPRREDAWARMVELDSRNTAAARKTIEEIGLDRVEVVEADAGCTDVYAGAVPADLVLMCGVFGHLSEADIRSTVAGLLQLCARGATVIWTRGRGGGDLTPSIRQWFADEGFSEQAFVSPGFYESAWSVGVHRLTASPQPLSRGQRLFSFIRG